MGELMVADVRAQVALSLITDFVNYSEFAPNSYHVPAVETMLDQVVAWSEALAPLRAGADTRAAA
jgi:hypothetical protein